MDTMMDTHCYWYKRLLKRLYNYYIFSTESSFEKNMYVHIYVWLEKRLGHILSICEHGHL